MRSVHCSAFWSYHENICKHDPKNGELEAQGDLEQALFGHNQASSELVVEPPPEITHCTSEHELSSSDKEASDFEEVDHSDTAAACKILLDIHVGEVEKQGADLDYQDAELVIVPQIPKPSSDLENQGKRTEDLMV